MPFTTTSTMWQLSFPMAEADARALAKEPAALAKEIRRRCAGWHEPVPSLLRATPESAFSGYPVYDRDPLDPAALRRARLPYDPFGPTRSHSAPLTRRCAPAHVTRRWTPPR